MLNDPVYSYIPSVYLASKIPHAEKLRHVRRTAAAFMTVTSRWLDVAQQEQDAAPDDFTRFWLMDVHDIRRSDFVLCYAEAGDHLRGALVEAGYALGNGIPVILVGDGTENWGSWQHHPLVHRCDHWVTAFEYLAGFRIKKVPV